MPKDMNADIKLQIIDGKSVELPSGDFVSNAQMTRDGMDLHLTSPDGQTIVVEGYFAQSTPPDLFTHDGARLSPALVDSFVPPERVGQYAAAGNSMSDESPAGKIMEISGEATIVRADGTKVAASVGTPVYQGDVVETSKTGAVNIQFADNTTFAISESARMSVDKFIYDSSAQSGSSFFSMLQGVFVYTSGLIGKSDPGNVNIETPVGSIGIRGTVVAGQIAPAGKESKITILDGAITFTNGAGTHEMSDSFNTVALNGYQQAPTDMGHMDAQTFNSTFKAISSVAGDTVSHFSAAAPATPNAPAQGNNTEQGNAPKGEAPSGAPDVAPAPADAQGGKAPVPGEGGAPAPAEGAAPPAGAPAPDGTMAPPAGAMPPAPPTGPQGAAREGMPAPAMAGDAGAPMGANMAPGTMAANAARGDMGGMGYGMGTMAGAMGAMGTMGGMMGPAAGMGYGPAPAGAGYYGPAPGSAAAAMGYYGPNTATGTYNYVPPGTNNTTNYVPPGTTTNTNTIAPFHLGVNYSPEYNNAGSPGIRQFAAENTWTGVTVQPFNAIGAVTYHVAVNLATPVYNMVPIMVATASSSNGSIGAMTASSLLTSYAALTNGETFRLQAGAGAVVDYTITSTKTVQQLIDQINDPSTPQFHAELDVSGHLKISTTNNTNLSVTNFSGDSAIDLFGAVGTIGALPDFKVININPANAFTIDAQGHINVNDKMILSHYINPNGFNLTITATDSTGRTFVTTSHLDIRDYDPNAPDTLRPIPANTGDLNGNSGANFLVLTGVTPQNISGGGGADILIGNSQNNVIRVYDPGFRLVDGGLGEDTLRLGHSGASPQTFNAATINGDVYNIEKIDLGEAASGFANNVSLNIADVFEMTSGNHVLHIGNLQNTKTGTVTVVTSAIGAGAQAGDVAFHRDTAFGNNLLDLTNASDANQEIRFVGTYRGQSVTLVIHQTIDDGAANNGGVAIATA